MRRKKYVLSRWFSLVTSFRTPSGLKVVTFENGSRYHDRKGYFVTSDEELQKAIESSGYFGSEILLEQEEVIGDKSTKKEEAFVTPTVKSYEDYLPNPAEAVRETTVTTLQKAKMWLQATHGKTFKSTSKDDIQREAAEVYNTLFVNWK